MRPDQEGPLRPTSILPRTNVTYPTPPRSTPPKSTGTRKSSSSRTSSAPPKTASSDPYAKQRADAKAAEGRQQANQRSAEARANASQKAAEAKRTAEQKAQELKASVRFTAQAERLLAQGNALKLALGNTGLRATLLREIGNSDLEFSADDALILSQYGRGKTELEKQAAATEDNRAHSFGEATSNAGRERNEALQQGIENGISATDMIKTQAASLRNWAFNVSQAQTNYTDEINGLQSEHSQMVNSVVTSRQASFREREQQRSQLYRGYYDNRGQVLTEIGNKQGEAAQNFDMANEQVASGSSKAKAKSSSTTAMANLRAAALETGKGYKELATPTSITKWQGTAKIKNSTDARQWGKQELQIKDAEGASKKLRRWEG